MLKSMWRGFAALAVAFLCVLPARVSYADTPEGLAHFIVGSCLRFQGENDAALLEYSKAAQQDPSSFPIQMRLGLLAVEAQSPRLAIDAFNAAIKLRPEDLEVRYLLAVVYSSVKDFDNAALQYEFILQKFTTTDPKNVDYCLFLGQLYLTQGKIKQAVAQLEKVLLLQPNNTDVLLQVGTYYLENDRRKDGVKLLQACVAAEPLNAPCLNALGYTYAEDRVRLDEASRMIGQALKIEPGQAAYLDSLGWVRYQEGKWSEALALLEEALAKEKDPLIYDHIGDVYQKMNRPDLALAAWREAQKLDAALVGLAVKISLAEKKLKKNKR